MSRDKSKYKEFVHDMKSIKPSGPYEFPDEVEDEIMGGERYITLPETGYLRFHNVEPAIPVEDKTVLPRRPTNQEYNDQNAGSYRAKRIKNPIATGAMTNLFVDSEAKFKEMNEVLSQVSEAMLTLPFVCLLVGSIGAGKTTTLLNLLNQLTIPGGFEEVVIASRSLGADGLIMSWLRSRTVSDKARVNVVLQNRLTAEDLQKQKAKMQKYNAQFMELAMRGRVKVESEKKQDDLSYMMRPYSSVITPFTDEKGEHTGRDPKIFDYSSFREPFTTWDNGDEDQGESRRRDPHLVYPQRPLIVERDGLIKGRNLCLDEIVVNAMHTSKDFQESAEQLLKLRACEKPSDSSKANERPKPVLYVIEDGAYSVSMVEMLQELSVIRHLGGSVLCLVQKFRSIHLFLRTIVTDLIIFNVGNRQEEEALEEEYGGRIPHFKEKLYACTQPIPGGNPKGNFMFCKLREHDCVFRNFESRLVYEGPTQTEEVDLQIVPRGKQHAKATEKEAIKKKSRATKRKAQP